MAAITVTPGTSASDVVLAANTLFSIIEGAVTLSTDAGTTNIPFGKGEKIIFASGLTVRASNRQNVNAVFAYMPV